MKWIKVIGTLFMWTVGISTVSLRSKIRTSGIKLVNKDGVN